MKKIFCLFFTFAVLVLMMTSCGLVIRDYTCETLFIIVNRTDSEIRLLRGVEGSEKVTIIAPGEEIIADEKNGMCGKNTIRPPRPDDAQLLDDMVFKLKVDGKIVLWEIWRTKYWDFASEVYHATYTLNVTDELIESIGFVEY